VILEQDRGAGVTNLPEHNGTYGAQAAKVAKTIGSDLTTGIQVFEAFWDAAFPLKMLKETLQKEWEANGKKFIIGIDGRRVPTRSAHAILNSLFQSGGVICAKRAMVIHDVLLKENGLAVDFFLEDWKNKKFCQQMIAYHDEAQLEVSASEVTFKRFATKEEAQAFKDVQQAEFGKVWSDISHATKGGGYFVAFCEAGVLAVKAVSLAGQFYSTELVPIDLTAGYILGNSWASCH